MFLLSGCLYTTHHFNTGRLLEPGRTSFTLGAGVSGTVSYGCPEESAYSITNQTGVHCINYHNEYIDGKMVGVEDTVPQQASTSRVINSSLGYRLGVRGPFGPFKGAEVGLHMESPTNPVTGEFDLKVGLPAPKVFPLLHSLSAGWGIGAWADNTYFLEYAASRPFGANDLFFNYRATYLASQFADQSEAESARRFEAHHRLIHQAAAGFSWVLPDIPVLPDFLAPEAILTYPLAPVGTKRIPAFVLDDRLWGFNLGFGWNFK
jgi:hypothetical protein